jgi:hypothetical protein
MKRVFLLFLLFLTLPNAYGQTLKLRLEPGIGIPLTTYDYGSFWYPFSNRPIPNDYFHFEKTWKSNRFLEMHSSIWLQLGFETQKGVQFELGYHPREGLQYYLLWEWDNHIVKEPSTGTDLLLSYGYFIGFHIPGNKVRGSVALPMNNEKKHGFLWSTILGGSWLHFGKDNRNSAVAEGSFPEHLYPDTAIRISAVHWIRRANSFMLLGGVQLSYKTKKRELLSLRLVYEQGLFLVGQVDYYVIRNNTMIAGSVASRGSAFHLKLSVPIDLYSFSKHKKHQS